MFKIILYIGAGFFCYMVSLIGFAKAPSTGEKLAILCVFSIPGLIAFWAGAALDQFQNWRKPAGLILLSGAGFTLFVIITFICVSRDPALKPAMKPETRQVLSDYVTGFSLLAAMAVTGGALLKTKTSSEPPPVPIDLSEEE